MAYSDPGHDAAEEEIARLSKRLHAAYSRAYREMAERAKDDLERQAEADADMVAKVKSGEMTAEQLAAWRRGRAADATWYAQMVDQLARDMAQCDRQAAAIINGASPAVFAENANYGAYQVEQAANADTSWTLVDADTVATLVRDQPDLLPQVSPKPSKAEAWARRKITSAITQSVLVGESVPAASRRLRSVVDMGERAATRAARTALTGAENAGRTSSYDRARGMGIDVRARWMATLDSRTRDSHRQLDGEVAGDDGRFSNGLRYPGDPAGPASEVWNCRCTLVASMPGYDAFEDRNTSKLETSYEDWKAGRDPKSAKPSGRSLREFMGTPAAERAAKKASISKAQLRKRIVSQLNADGKTGRDFPSMTRAEQQTVLSSAVERGITDKRYAYPAAKVDVEYVKSREYASRFKGLTGNAKLDRSIAEACRSALVNRSGTSGEDLILISRKTGEIVARSNKKTVPNETVYTEEIVDAIKSHEPGSLISVHNHPTNIPPTGSDFSAQLAHSYGGGVVALHNGDAYYFEQGEEPVSGVYFDQKVSRLVSNGADESDAILSVMERLQEEGRIRWMKI